MSKTNADQPTPGPWRTEYRESGREEEDGEMVRYCSQQIIDANNDLIATVAWTVHPDDSSRGDIETNRQANAELIAAAPNMRAEIDRLRDSLREALDHADYFSDALDGCGSGIESAEEGRCDRLCDLRKTLDRPRPEGAAP